MLIEALNTALLELQSAMNARSLYPSSHPKIRNGEQRAFRLLAEATRHQPEATLFAVGDRVIHEGSILPSSQHLSQSLFARLQEKGVDRVTFRRGLTGEELRALLDALCVEEGPALEPSVHLGLGYIQKLEYSAPVQEAVPEPGAVPIPSELVHVLGNVWNDVHEKQQLRTDMLGDIILDLTRSLSASGSTVLPLASVKSHDEYTFIHTINVAMLATALAEAVGFADRTLHELNMAALLHDVGKQAIPKKLLNKAGKYTDDEFAIVQRHPVDGARMLMAIPGVPEIATVVAYEHHVRADGTGYPRVPRGWRLSLASRIVQVADVFDALRTHRPYRPAMPLERIVRIMREDVGTLFDADLVEVFLSKVLGRGVPAAFTP